MEDQLKTFISWATDQIKAVVRRLESVEKTLNLIFKDRDIMEQTHMRVGTLQDQVQTLQDRVAKLEKKLSADVAEVKDTVDEIKDNIE